MNLAETLNLGCLCRTLNPDRLRKQLETDPCLQGMLDGLATTHPHLFSETAVFVDPGMRAALGQAIAAIERVVALPAYQQGALANASEIARHDFGPAGVFMGYDFHLGSEGPRLIEINTNAGGAPTANAASRCRA